jgi:class 3 adenylate cyclase/tetratricopeptide (TPR) repeat protein
MKCAHCQTDNSDDASFCDECGAPVDMNCSHCGESNRPSAKFCRKCGQRLGVAAAVSAAESSAGQTVVPKHLAEKILASRRFIEGERKQVTVLFADIRGSTSVVEKLDPEEVRKYFDPILHIMMDAVHRYEGTVNQVLGDGIMALFGAPLTHQDHALRACYAALAMQEAMRRYSDVARDDGALKIGIGLNSGEVVVRSITNDLNIDYAALGHTTHLAARMEALAGAGAILLTADTLREVEGFVEVRSLGARELKGFSNAVQAFELTGVTTARTRLQAQAARGLSNFVGRQNEIDLFRRLTAEAGSGQGRVLALVGEAGMGKSRLVREFMQLCLPSDWKVVQAFSVSYGKATPFFPVIELLRSHFAVAAGEDSQSARSKVLQRLLALDPSHSAAAPPILALLDALPQSPASDLERYAGVAEAIATFNAAEPQERRSRTFDALKQLLLRESEAQPLLVLFEDLHWIDSETQAFLDLLVESVPAARMLLLVNYRPGYTHTWTSRDYYTGIRLDPLPPSGADALLASLLGEGPELASLRELLIKRTGGNPFFIEEIVRSLAETGALLGSRGAYTLGTPIDAVRVPSTVRTVLAERVDRLPAAEKQLLQTAAVIGVVVLVRLLRAVTGLPDDELRRYLFNLQAAEFIFESNLFPELEYTFKHALVDEVVYSALLHDRRITLHGSIVRALEQIGGDHPADHIEALAYHAAQAELWEAAVRYSRQAAAKAMSRSAFLEAVANYRKALTALTHLPDSPAKLAEEIDLHLDARNVLFLLGDSKGVAEQLHAAEPLAERLGDEQRLARVLNFLNSYYGLAGDPERAIEIGKRALKLGVIQADPASNTVTYYYLGAAYNKTGQYGLAIDVLTRGVKNIGADRRHERFGTAAVLSVICRSHLVQCLAATGRFTEGALFGEEGVRIGEEVEHPTSLIHMLCSVGMLHLLKGDCDQAIPILEKGLELCRSANIPVYVPVVASRLGSAYANSKRAAEALPHLEEAVESSAAAGRAAFLALNTASLAEGYLFLDRIDEARRLAERAFELAKQYKEQGHQAWTLKLLGDISMHESRRDPPGAETHYRQALALSEELGMRPLAAHCRMGVGAVFAALGAFDRARAEVDAAREHYRDMAMTRWLDRADTALKNLAH